MQTGATIHTMNGLNLIVRKRELSDDPVEDDGWWEQQHIKRGLDSKGKPYNTPEDAVWSSTMKSKTPGSIANKDGPEGMQGGCPVKH